MNNVLILTFSGTGNTSFAVDAVVRSLVEKGVQASSYPMEKLVHHPSPDIFPAAGMIGIAFPVHAFNPPPLVEKIIRALPAFQTPRKSFILKTCGSPVAEGGITTVLKRLLARKNLVLQYENLVPMPSNFAIRYSDPFIKMCAQMARKQADQIANALIQGEKKILPADWKTQILSTLIRTEHLGAHIFGHYLKVSDSCTQCGLCVRNCPTGNIHLEGGRFRFGWHCTFCMRCSFYCPVQAFEHKHVGTKLFVKPPWDLQHILDDPAIVPADVMTDKTMGIKDFRKFYRQEGLIK